MDDLRTQIRTCSLCAERFAETRTRHKPRPIVWFAPEARILIAGQAPGARVHDSGTPFLDASGDRLREWLGLDSTAFYDQSKVAIIPMAFCFPGYDAKGSDLPPPKICSETWHPKVFSGLPDVRLTLLVGGYAHRWHLNVRSSVTDTVANWRDHAPSVFPLPHPSWRNTGWLKRHPWFEAELLPDLRTQIRKALDG